MTNNNNGIIIEINAMDEPNYEDINRMEQDDDDEEGKCEEYSLKYILDLSWAIGPLSSCCCMMTLFKFQKGYLNLGTSYFQHET